MNTKYPLIIDLSRYRVLPDGWKNDDPNAVVMGVITKLTQGTWWEDPSADQIVGVTRENNLPLGGYHFFEPNDIARQVDKFMSVYDRLKLYDETIPPSLDLEYTPGANGIVGARLAEQVFVWLDGIETRTGGRPWLYSSTEFLRYMMTPIQWVYVDAFKKYMWATNQNSVLPAWVNTYEKWLAEYPDKPDPQSAPSHVLNGMDGNWTLWQYTSKQPLNCFVGGCDGNVYNGTVEQWQTRFGGRATIPPIGENMNKVTVTYDAGANVRPLPNTTTNVLRVLPDNTVLNTPYPVTVDAVGNEWIRITESPAEYICTNYYNSVRAIVTPIVAGSVTVNYSVNGVVVSTETAPAGSVIDISLNKGQLSDQ